MFCGPYKAFIIRNPITRYLIFLPANAKQSEDQLGDFADDEEEQDNAEADPPLFFGQWDCVEDTLQDP